MATKRWTSGSASMATSSASTRARTMSACDGAFDDNARARVARDRRSRARGTDLGREAATRARAVDMVRVEEWGQLETEK